jgi:Cd2+/Zn2+-exporting ATPase
MGGIGADAALETADVVLLHDDLNRIAWSFGLARRVRRVMVANLVFAIGVIATLAIFTVLGKVPMPIGVIGHEGSTLLVVANSLRLLAHREP